MFKLTCLAVLLATATTASADMDVKWSRTFDVKGAPDVVLKSNDAPLNITAWTQSKVQAVLRVEGYDSSDYEVIPKQTGDHVEVEVRLKRTGWQLSWGFARRRIWLEVTMPAKANLDASTSDGHVDVRGLAGKTVVHAGSGHILLNDLRGAVEAHAGNGHIDAGGRFEQLNLESGNGHVIARVDDGSSMAANWTVRTASGHINVVLPRDFGVMLDASTENGHVSTNLARISNVSTGPRDRRSFRGQIGKGGRTLVVHSRNGAVRISER